MIGHLYTLLFVSAETQQEKSPGGALLAAVMAARMYAEAQRRKARKPAQTLAEVDPEIERIALAVTQQAALATAVEFQFSENPAEITRRVIEKAQRSVIQAQDARRLESERQKRVEMQRIANNQRARALIALLQAWQ